MENEDFHAVQASFNTTPAPIMTDLETFEPNLCQRLCCCLKVRIKEPPVQFIGSGKLQTPTTTKGHISPAEHTIDGFEDVDLERSTVNQPRPRVIDGKEPKDTLNMNDIMMNEIIGDDKMEDVDTVIEDAVSISTDVVEEVDEVELSRLQLQSGQQQPSDIHDQHDNEGKLAENEAKEEEATQSFVLEDHPSTSKVHENISESNQNSSSEAGEKVNTETEQNNSDMEEEDTMNMGPSSSETSKVEENTTDSEEEIMIYDVPRTVQNKSPYTDAKQSEQETTTDDVRPTVKQSLDRPSLPPKSIMYADASFDENDNQEENDEIMTPIQRSQGIVNLHEALNDPSDSWPNVDLPKTDTSRRNPFNEEDIALDYKNTKRIMEEELTTSLRIVVGNDSKPNHFSSVAVAQMNSDGREVVSDDEFSEKLI